MHAKKHSKTAFQSTFPRRERLAAGDVKRMATYVSIHVPAKGTTGLPSCVITACAVSIHVPAKGTTKFRAVLDKYSVVSIHVPAKGTTAIIHKFLYVPYYYLYNYTNIILIEQVHLPYTSYSPLIFSQYCGANLPDTLCSLLFRTRPALHCCFI